MDKEQPLQKDSRLRHKMKEDVHRVYELPKAGKKIDLKLCSDLSIKKLRAKLNLAENCSAFVNVIELEEKVKSMEDPKVWVKAAIMLVIHNVLCPTNSSLLCLQYAHILEDPSGVTSYNWCSHILEHIKEGIASSRVVNPTIDFHFLMINYMEKMGMESPFLTGKYKRPSLRDWDVTKANQLLA
ncbi:hypothetical protein LIER_35765 [Lithospermum erythrorhizon]|uniref:Uncharacterized protein n=1 Tax=Lithospermum erythrorhizon TaxID=34254 RepID=A0AAV3NXV4_LITER